MRRVVDGAHGGDQVKYDAILRSRRSVEDL
jgi:hypothetical protein